MDDVELQSLVKAAPETPSWYHDAAETSACASRIDRAESGPTTIQIEIEELTEASPSSICKTSNGLIVADGYSAIRPLFTSAEDVQWVLNIMESNMYAHDAKIEFEKLKKELDEGVPATLHEFLNFLICHWRYRLKSTTPSGLKNRAKAINFVAELLSKSDKKTEVLEHFDGVGTLLSNAIELDDFDMVKALVRAGANVNLGTTTGQTTLQAAAKSSPTMLKYFLDMGMIENPPQEDECSAICYAIRSGSVESVKLLLEKFGPEQLTWRTNKGRTIWHEIALHNAIEIAQYLVLSKNLKYRTGLNVLDNYDCTPVLYAIHGNHEKMAAFLLRNGAALSVKGDRISAVELITSNFIYPTRFLEDLFDDCIYRKGKELSLLYVDYKLLVDRDEKGKSQITVLEEFVNCNQSELLKHPTIESLIYLKWTCSLPVFYIILATYATFLFSLNTFVITTFNELESKYSTNDTSCSNHTQAKSAPMAETNALCVESCQWHYWLLTVFIYTSGSVILIQEYLMIKEGPFRKFTSLRSCKNIRLQLCCSLRFEPCVKLLGLLLALSLPLVIGCEVEATPWRRHLVCAALLLAWLQAMLLLSRFPVWGYYVLMFVRVAINILKIFVTSICLVIGFSICFLVQYQSKPPFDGPVAAFIKTMVMMLSEFEYEDLFDEKHKAELKDTKTVVRLLFVVFVIFIAIVLMNFMIGVAVSDVNELAALGDVRRLEKQLELLSTVENVGNTVCGKRWTTLSSVRFHKAISKPLNLFDPLSTTDFTGRNWKVAFSSLTSDSYQLSITSELHSAILRVASKNKEGVNKLDAIYDSIVFKKVDNSRYSQENIYQKFLEIIDDLKNTNDRIQCVEETSKYIKQSVDDLKEGVMSIFITIANDRFFTIRKKPR